MAIDTVENVITLLSVIIGILYSIFNYIRLPRRGLLYISVFFLTHLLSDYYWTTYTLVIGDNPDVSEMMAYFGWNVGYLFLLFAAVNMRPEGSRRFIHPLMFIPIPLNIVQFFIYIQYGGIFNNIWEGVLATSVAVICLQVLLYYLKNKENGAEFPLLHLMLLLHILCEYGMWTASCFDWPSDALNPYYYFAFGDCAVLVFLAFAATRESGSAKRGISGRSQQEVRFAILLQFTVTVIIFFGTIGGYYIGKQLSNSTMGTAADEKTLEYLANTLFVISILLVVFVLMIILMITFRYKSLEGYVPEEAPLKRSRFNFIFTILITLGLMVTIVLYNSRLFYRVSVAGVMEDGQVRAASTSEELENYLGSARSILWATADTVEIMLKGDEPQQKIIDYVYAQTKNQAEQFDENFTGLYAYIRGEYMDGSGWMPPAEYNIEERDWYRAAVDAGGETLIVPPYVDADTGSVVITICKLLDDGGEPGDYSNRAVVAIDMVVNYVQQVTEEVNISGKGYAMILGSDGLIVSHRDASFNSKNTAEIYGEDFIDSVIEAENGRAHAVLGGEPHTLFIDDVLGQWYVVVAVSDSELYSDTVGQLVINIIVSLVIFLLISFFYYLGYKTEQMNAKTLEDMRAENLKKEYEAQVLKQKEEDAEEASRAKSRFLAQMSHEIRTPINAVLGMNEMILRKSEDEEILEYSQNIDSAGNTLLALINSILDFSKIEDGKMDIIPVNYDTSALINGVVNSIRQRAEAKGLSFVLDIDETLPCTLYGDDVRVSQVMMNLLTNAVKYTEKGSVTFSMKSESRTGDKIIILVSVKDTGMGIREEDIDKLSVSFERLDEQKNRNIEGTGLGMSIVKSLLELMGSRICVESTYGEGSLFYFSLEQGIVDEKPIGDMKQSIAKGASKKKGEDLISAPDARVLVVDDNKMNIKVAANLLKLCSITPDSVLSGEEAIEKMEKNTYDIVLLDHMMPKMDGIETLAELRKRELIPEGTKVIVLTANAVVGAKEEYLAAGFDDYLSKPMEIKELVEALVKYLPEGIVR